MSTKHFQAYEDSVIAFNAAEEKMKNARKQFITHARETGTALRKEFISDDRRALASIATRTNDYFDTCLVLSMEVEVSSSKGHKLEEMKLQDIKHWLHSQGWKIVQDYNTGVGRGNFIHEKHYFICI